MCRRRREYADQEGVAFFVDLYSKVWSEFEEKLEEKIKKKTVDKADVGTFDNSLSVRIPTDSADTSPIPVRVGSHGLALQHVLGVDTFNKDQLNELFNLAQAYRIDVTKQRSLDHVLRVNKIGALAQSIFPQ